MDPTQWERDRMSLLSIGNYTILSAIGESNQVEFLSGKRICSTFEITKSHRFLFAKRKFLGNMRRSCLYFMYFYKADGGSASR
jgi:hypothetical protein